MATRTEAPELDALLRGARSGHAVARQARRGPVVAYALSPIDLIPDFVPVLGYLDDVIIVPAGIWLALKLVPPAVMKAARQTAEQTRERPASTVTAIVFVLIWLALGRFPAGGSIASRHRATKLSLLRAVW